MTLTEVVLRVAHDCPFGNICRKFPSVKMYSWWNKEHEILEIVINKHKEYSAVLEELSKIGTVFDMSPNHMKIYLISKNILSTSENSISKNIDSLNLLHVPPTMGEKGWEYHRIIAFRHEDINELMKRLEKMAFTVEIVGKVPFDGFISNSLTLTADALFANLTEKQIKALLKAHDYGYYTIPRIADVKEIAYKEKISRTTYQENLKKGENKLISALIPYLKLFNQASPEKRKKNRIELKKIT